MTLTITAAAQYRFDLWTADTGLPQNIIRAIHQTPDGYLWLATLDGLVRFDGVRFTVFNKSNSQGINSNRFIALYEDRDGALWLGTESGGVTRYHRGRFTTYTTQHGLVSNNVPGIRFANGRLTRWTKRDGLPSLNIYSVAEDPKGALWAATQDAGLVKIESGRVVKIRTVSNGLPGNEAWFIVGPEIKAFSKDNNGALWMTDPDTGQSHLMTRRPPDSLLGLVHYRLYEDREGNIWIGSEGGGLYRARKQAITAYSKQEGLTGRNTYPIYEDRAGAIWIGAEGLNRFSDGRLTRFTFAEGLVSPGVSAICEDRAGRLWVGAVGGLQILSGGRLRNASELGHVLPPSRLVQAILQDREGALWFGADRGLVRYRNGVSDGFTTRDGLASDDVKVIIEGAAGHLWIGSYGGLTRFKDGKFTVWTERDGLPSDSVRALYEDRDGALWIGTYDGGLGRFKDGRFTRYTTREGPYNDGVFQILEDARGNFWMSCNRGVYRVRKQELNDFAEGKVRSITSIAYGKSDGMFNAECNGGRWPAGIRARDGKLWFPTQDGAAVIDPEAIRANPQPPPVLIESVLVDREPVAFNDHALAAPIAPGKENIEIAYTALSFINSEQLRFKYKLEGLDQDWTEAGTRRSVYYSHIAPGDYTFKVIAADPAIQVVAEAEDGAAALARIREADPDVAVLDVDMPHKGGFDVVREMQSLHLPTRIIFLTMYKDEGLFNTAMDLGVKGYILKDSAITDIVAGIKAVAAGQNYISAPLATYLVNRSHRLAAFVQQKPSINDLTPTERRILKLIAEHKTSRQIAAELFVSVRTVERHRLNIGVNLDLHGSNALLKFALENKQQLL